MKNKILAASLLMAGLLALTSCGPDKSLKGKYTLNEAEAGSPETWNVHTWETNTDSLIMGYTEIGLWDYAYTKNDKGEETYEVVPEMAASLARHEALTEAEKTKYGYDAEETSDRLKWIIDLNPNAKWEDGTPINADTYVYSMKRFLDPEMQNFRASQFYTGDVALVGAKAYHDSDTSGTDAACNWIDDSEYVAATHDDKLTFVWDDKNISLEGWVAPYASYYNSGSYGSTIYEFAGAAFGASFSFSEDEVKALNGKKLSEVKADTKGAAILAELLEWWEEGDAGVLDFCSTLYSNPHYDWEDGVGIEKTGEYQITLFLESPISDFYWYYNMASNWIVNEAKYEAGRTKASGANLYSTNYGTSVDTYMSYGPYKLVNYQLDKIIELTRNENWYGWTDGKHEGQFQTTDIKIQIVPTQPAQLLLFEKGELDSVSLQGSDMEKYGNSSSLLYTPQSYTSKVTFNSSFDLLKANQETKEKEAKDGKSYNKTVLSNKKFREALSWSLNRLDFVQSMTAGSGVGLILVNSYYQMIDENTGEAIVYRDTNVGKKVITDVYGTSTTGYDFDKAVALLNEAFDEEMASEEEGSLQEGDVISLLWEVYNDDWMDYINYYIDNMQKAINASKFGTSGKVDAKAFIETKVTGDAYSDHITAGSCEMGMSTWGGGALDPLGVLQCYCDPSYQYEPGFDGSSFLVKVDFGGERGTVTKTLSEWYAVTQKGEFDKNNATMDERLLILAACETAYLKDWQVASIYTRQSVSMNSFKVINKTENYNMFYGYGGLRFMTYAYDDYEWAKLCQKNKKTGFDYTV